jgi:hypothetical protein
VDVVVSGPPVHPEDRIKLFSDQQWELFIQEWVDSLRAEYDLIQRCGDAGAMGRDVIATVKGGHGAWGNYQCKHYCDSLKPSGHRPANAIASGPGGVLRKTEEKLVMARGVYPDGLVALQRWRTAPVKERIARLPHEWH